ncbi:DOMON-like domain-containing protein [Allosphingosinicella sp.]|jgi:hypothetical protein|uniref:DOMON-like domain-containing protein n=1 Tax=Allosphingosinicella sp. TaxID=2823234 RepID=UPI002EF36FBE
MAFAGLLRGVALTESIEAELWAHPAHPPWKVLAVRARLERTGSGTLALRYEIDAPSSGVTLPPPALPGRADRLWDSTCFELFLRPELGTGYRELNFSPSGRWAAYEFTGRREGMRQTEVAAPPAISLQIDPERIAADILVALDLPDEPYELGLFVVVKEGMSRRSFWASSHSSSEPDFHHPACFAHILPPAPSE